MEVTFDWLMLSNCPLCCCPSPISTQCWPIPYFTFHPPLVWMATNWQWLLVAPPVLIIAPCIQRKNRGFHRRYTMSRKQPLFFNFRYSEYKRYLLLIWAGFCFLFLTASVYIGAEMTSAEWHKHVEGLGSYYWLSCNFTVLIINKNTFYLYSAFHKTQIHFTGQLK